MNSITASKDLSNAQAHPRRQSTKREVSTVDKHVRARRADSRDAEVGRRVRSRRLEQMLSQTELADRIGVTFQQVQKYEKGVNRIGAGRLERISEALEVPVSFFFGDGTSRKRGAKEVQGPQQPSVFGFLQTSGQMRIVKAFGKITSRKVRQLLVELTEECSIMSQKIAAEPEVE